MEGRACSSCHADVPGDARFCMQCGAPVEDVGEGERRIATILFADIVGSTELAVGVDPEDLRAELATFYEACRVVIEEFGGRIEKFIGDAVMAVFGVPRAFGDDADRAVAAGLRLVEAVKVPIRVGVNTGEILSVTSERSDSLAIAGEAVHAAARLQSAAAVGQVLIGERTAHALRSLLAIPAGTVTAKGFPHPVPVWTAVPGAGIPTDDAPFVGRSSELGLLRLTHDRSRRTPAGHLAVVLGDPGRGKSRLAGEYLRAARSAGDHVAYLASSPVHEASSAAGPLGLLSALLATPHADPERLTTVLAGQLTELGDDNAEDTARWVGVSIGAGVRPEVSGPVDEQVLMSWVRVLRTLARHRPVSVVVDDAQWADPTVAQLLMRTLAASSDLPVFVLLIGRPELADSLDGWLAGARHSLRYELPPLQDNEAHELVAHLLSSRGDLDAEAAVRRAGGNPFFLTELAHALQHPDSSPGGALLPDTVQASIAARLDALPVAARRVLQRASVLGQSFSVDAVAALGADVDAGVMDTLCRLDLVVSQDDADSRYAFRHGLIRDVVYGQLTRAARADLHERAADHLVAAGGARHLEVAADQLQRAAELGPTPDRGARASMLLAAAADAALARGSGQRAQELLASAAALSPDPAQRVSYLRSAAWGAYARWQGDSAYGLLMQLADAAAAADDAAAECEACAMAVEITTRFSATLHDPPSVAETAELVARAERCLPAGDLRLAAHVRGVQCWQAARSAPVTEEEIAHVLDAARRAGDPRLLSFALDTATAQAWNAGQLERAAKLAAERWPYVRQLDDPNAAAVETVDTLLMLADTALYVGDIKGYRDGAELLFAREQAEAGSSRAGRARRLLSGFLLGQWSDLMVQVAALEDDWRSVGKPAAGFAVSALAAATMACRLRADQVGVARLTELIEQFSPRAADLTRVWQAVFEAQADVHLGDARGAAERLAVTAPSTNTELAPFLAAAQADAAAAAHTPDADDVIARTEEHARLNRFTEAIWLRAQGVHLDDPAILHESWIRLRELGATYEAARTGWLLGGEAAEAAGVTFAALGIPAPVMLVVP